MRNFDSNSQINLLFRFFKNYIDILEDVKNIQMNRINLNHNDNMQVIIEEDEEPKENKKFIKQIVRRNSNIITGKNLISNIISQKLTQNRINVINEYPPYEPEALNHNFDVRKRSKESENSSSYDSKNDLCDQLKSIKVDPVQINTQLQLNNFNRLACDYQDKSVNINSISNRRRSSVNLNNFLMAFKRSRTISVK